MKRRICLIIVGIILVAILAFAFYKLSAGDSFEKTLVSSEWYVQPKIWHYRGLARNRSLTFSMKDARYAQDNNQHLA